jgi:hypothetical protein
MESRDGSWRWLQVVATVTPGQFSAPRSGALVARHRKDPGADILGMLIREHHDNVSDEELVGIGNILLIAGHETTANTIGLGTLLLTQHPDQLAMVRDDPTVLRTAVEEILRFLSIVHTGSPRGSPRTSRSAGRRSRPGRWSWCRCRRRTGTRTSSPTPTCSTSGGLPARRRVPIGPPKLERIMPGVLGRIGNAAELRLGRRETWRTSDSGHQLAAGRGAHRLSALARPWAHLAMIVRLLLGLEPVLSMAPLVRCMTSAVGGSISTRATATRCSASSTCVPRG